MRINRGLLSLSKRGPLNTIMGYETKSANKVERLQKAAPCGVEWRETWQEMKSLAAGHPDIHGRRLFDPKAKNKARYVAQVAYRAYLKRQLPLPEGSPSDAPREFREPLLPVGKEWGYLRSAVLFVYRSLEGSNR